MKQLTNAFLIAGLVLLGSLAQANTRLLFKITESGPSRPAEVILCLNAKASLSCQHYAVSKKNLAIKTTINRTYPDAGIAIVTPEYRATGCTQYVNGYCLFEANGNTPKSIAVEEIIPSSYKVGGQVQGLLGVLVLENNGGDLITINADGGFNFPVAITTGGTYSVAVHSQPVTQTCTVNNAAGTIMDANVTNVMVNCSTHTRTVGGNVSGLAVSESVVLQNNGGDDLIRTSNGGFTFSASIAQGATYNVTVLTQPTTQTCTVTNGSGTAGASDITNVQVTCATNAYTVGGVVSGLTGTLVLQNNGADDLSVSATPFNFATSVAQGASYAVTVLTQPAGQVCNVTANGSGTMGGANVTNVAIGCLTNTTLSNNSASSLALSVTGRTEHGIGSSPPTASGVARVITINNTGSDDAMGFQVSYSGLPTGTTHTGTCDGLTSLAHGASCTIQINPGATATSNNSAVSCKNGTAPIVGTVEVKATNASAVSTSVVVLDYGCIYRGGYVFAFDDTTATSGSVAGKVVSTADQLFNGSSTTGVWSSNGGGHTAAFVDKFNIPGILHNSVTPCVGNRDGACNTTQIVNHYTPTTTYPLNYYAAGLCRQTIATYSDWYLPAVCEMSYYQTGANTTGCGSQAAPLIQNIQSSLRDIAVITVPNGFYWSSTESVAGPTDNAWTPNITTTGSSGQFYNGKEQPVRVRCVRAVTF